MRKCCWCLVLAFVLISGGLFAQGVSEPTEISIEASDLDRVVGTWEGSLTYIDYQSGKPFSMPANLIIERGKKNTLVLHHQYPNEPKANGKDKWTISKDGKSINGKSLKLRETIKEGEVKFITEYPGKDGNDNRSALIREIYIMGVNRLVVRKEVQFIGDTNWIKRSEFEYQRKE